MYPIYGWKCLSRKAVPPWCQTFLWWWRGWNGGAEVVETTVERFLCCWFRRICKAIRQVYNVAGGYVAKYMFFTCSNITCFMIYIHLCPIYWLSFVDKFKSREPRSNLWGTPMGISDAFKRVSEKRNWNLFRFTNILHLSLSFSPVVDESSLLYVVFNQSLFYFIFRALSSKSVGCSNFYFFKNFNFKYIVFLNAAPCILVVTNNLYPNLVSSR
jgi:hypothetical protein